MHALHPGHPTASAPAFAPRSAGHASNRDVGCVGLVIHAPGAGLVRRQRGQVGKVMAAAAPHATSCRARLRIEADGSERLAAYAAKSSLSHGHMLHIFAASRPFKIGLSATAAMTLSHCRKDFCENPRPLDAPLSQAQRLEP